MGKRRGTSGEGDRENERARAVERKRGTENEAGRGQERYANMERQIEKRKDESEEWSRCGKYERAKRQGAKERINKQLAILSCTPVCVLIMQML